MIGNRYEEYIFEKKIQIELAGYARLYAIDINKNMFGIHV
jgi:hypothetical protein